MLAAAPNLMSWIRARDGDLLALRRAGRAAIVMPGLFAIGVKVIGNPTVGAFAAFGAFSMLLLASFGGPMAGRVRAHIALALCGAVFVTLGTLVSTVDWLAAIVTAALAFAVLFAGVVSSVLASATTALLLSLILPVSLPGAAATIPDRLAGWGMAAGASLLAITLLWPSPTRNQLRGPAISATRALAARLRAHVAYMLGAGAESGDELTAACDRADEAVQALERSFYATPYRPTGLSTGARVLVRLVDEIGWLNSVVFQAAGRSPRGQVDRSVCAVKTAAASVLEAAADVLEHPEADPDVLRLSLAHLRDALLEMEAQATVTLPPSAEEFAREGGDGERVVDELVTALDPAFRAQELSFVVSHIGANADAVGAAERRGWQARVLGRQPMIADTLTTAEQRAASHLESHSVWLHNSLRGATALGVAVLLTGVIGAEHAFWVVLGALSVLRSNALATGQNAVRGLLGTVFGFVIGGALVTAIGSDTTVLWLLLAPAVLVAGVAPSAISFATGQAAFTVTLVILYNILAPTGWVVGLVRVEDIALGCGVSLAVGLLFWPRGAAAALGDALAQAYTDGARYLAAAVAFGMGRCDAAAAPHPSPTVEANRAASSARRLDDTFRTYLAERGAKHVPLAEVTALVTGVAGLRLAADAVLDLWQRDHGAADGDRAAARQELIAGAELVSGWYERLAGSLAGAGEVPQPLPREVIDDGRLLDALTRDLSGASRQASATAVRMIWTSDHLDAALRLQHTLVDPARAAVAGRQTSPPSAAVRWLPRRPRPPLELQATQSP
jgi:Fusaric acid resistance protein-like